MRIVSVVLLSFFTFSFATNLNLSKQNHHIEDSRIAWGTIVESINEYPFNIILVASTGFNSYLNFCSASLIDEEWLVTAAHCADAAQDYIDWGSTIYAFMGTIDIYNTSEETFEANQVLEILIHPEYSSQSLQNDIAIFKIEPVQFNEGIQPILLSNSSPEHESFAKVTGYGSTENGYGGFLREADMIIYNQEIVQPDLFYATGLEVNGNLPSPCPGDSGGPLFILNDMDVFELIGVSSFILGDCVNNYYTGFQNVSYHSDWINSTTGILTSQAGDVNQDGTVNILDIMYTVGLIVTNEYEENSDLNGDGIINILDIVSIVNIIFDSEFS